MSVKLRTIQKREKLNDVHAMDDPGAGGAYHVYAVHKSGDDIGPTRPLAVIAMQNGPRKDNASIHGVIDSDLLEIVRHRLQCFQAGEFASRENAVALTHIEEALMWMNRRVEDRIERNVLGTYNK